MSYQAAAASIYDPQQQSEASVLERGKANSEFALDQEAKSIDPHYNDAIKSVKTARAAEGARTDLNYSTALSGQASSLQNNEQRMLGEKMMENTTKLETERNDKKSAVATRRKMVGDDYTAGMSALAAKYSGLKSAFITDAQRRDQDIAREAAQRAEDIRLQQSMAARQRAWQVEDRNFNAALTKSQQPTKEQVVADLFTNYNRNDPKQRNFTENSVVPALQAKLGISNAEARNLAYKFRKQVFGE